MHSRLYITLSSNSHVLRVKPPPPAQADVFKSLVLSDRSVFCCSANKLINRSFCTSCVVVKLLSSCAFVWGYALNQRGAAHRPPQHKNTHRHTLTHSLSVIGVSDPSRPDSLDDSQICPPTHAAHERRWSVSDPFLLPALFTHRPDRTSHRLFARQPAG